MRALIEQTLPPDAYEIIVVDDGSTDATVDRLSAFQQGPARVRMIRLPTNRGRSAARNAGVREATAPLVVFTDSDVIVRAGFLEHHLRAHRTHGSRVLSRGPVIVVPDVTAARAAPVPRFPASPAFLDTANAGVARAVLLEAGLFDEAFPGYGWEDFELGLRLRGQGVRRVFVHGAVAFHVQPLPDPDSLAVLLQKEDERARSAVYFYRKHPGFHTRWLIQATVAHRAAYWLQAGGGLLTLENITAVVDRLRRAGTPGLAYLAIRSILNRRYVSTLGTELHRHARVA